jgi:hypothetical protein
MEESSTGRFLLSSTRSRDRGVLRPLPSSDAPSAPGLLQTGTRKGRVRWVLRAPNACEYTATGGRIFVTPMRGEATHSLVRAMHFATLDLGSNSASQLMRTLSTHIGPAGVQTSRWIMFGYVAGTHLMSITHNCSRSCAALHSRVFSGRESFPNLTRRCMSQIQAFGLRSKVQSPAPECSWTLYCSRAHSRASISALLCMSRF